MRSNGAVHIGNDAFLAVTRDITDSVFLFSSSFPPQEQIAPLPLNRKTRFHPHASLLCSEAELRRYANPANRAGPLTEDGGREETEIDAAASTPLFRHSTHASPDGRKIAFISNVRCHHYIMDISVVPAVVCEVEMPEVVRSVCWHTVAHHVLCVLFISGDLIMYDTDHSHLGVIVPRHRRIALRPVVERCLADTKLHVHRSRSSPSTARATADPSNNTTAPDDKEVQNANAKSPVEEARTRGQSPTCVAHPAPGSASGVRLSALCGDNVNTPPRAALHRVQTATDSSCGTIVCMGNNEVALVSVDDEGNMENGALSLLNPKLATLPTSQLNLVDMCALSPTESTPAILLLLSSSGDVYAVHLRDDCLPVLETAAATDDGRVRTREENALGGGTVMAEASLSVEVYHLISGVDTCAAGDEALAIGGCLIDADAGTHAVFFCTANGLIQGAWVSEPDLLARHRVAHVHAIDSPNISFTLHLSGHLEAQAFMSPAVPSVTHTVGMILSQNMCVVRSGYSGERAFVISFPQWDRRRQGWVCWPPVSANAREQAYEETALPLLSTDAAPPLPIVLRLPYDTSDASIAVGRTELVLVPEVFKMNGSCKRHHTLAISLAALLRSALYARCGTLLLCPSPETDTRSHLRDPQPVVLDTLNAVPECHRCWLRGVPEAEISAATLNLAKRVEELTGDVNRREVARAQRQRQLMARLAGLESRVAEMNGMLAHWQQIILDGVVHRRGSDAFHTANDRLGKVFARLNELEQQL
ncbi:hypothetical protein JKF63_05680 [Porcisia hertigi]|uniref:Uncharacterized protein n=1 Tax=Porcisia hertigi TaxID=2761500 RepID=A0A836LCX7_9TRYP|nr:hypothetical protein JKF63_05680 [Porcisia hertigi]